MTRITAAVTTAEQRVSWRKRLREMRRDSGLSMRELGAKVGKSPATVWEWEHEDGTEPSLADWVRLGAIFGVCPGALAFSDWSLHAAAQARAAQATESELVGANDDDDPFAAAVSAKG